MFCNPALKKNSGAVPIQIEELAISKPERKAKARSKRLGLMPLLLATGQQSVTQSEDWY
jgi:hypothetical protein